MRKLLILAFLLYDVATTTRVNYDYDYNDSAKRHSIKDDRRNWRKKALSSKTTDERDWGRRRYESEALKNMEETDAKPFNGLERQRDEYSAYRAHRYQENDKAMQNMPPAVKSAEIYSDKEILDKRLPPGIICDKQHERYESCFAGCASVTCDNPRDRMQACYPFCEAGCICVQPFVRDDRTHKCVLPEDCTKGLKGIPDLGEDVLT